MTNNSKTMSSRYLRNRRLMWIIFAALVILHQDWWFWNNGSLVFGFLPIGLAYQILITLAASALWGWAAFNAWPDHFDELADKPTGDVPSH
jgi:hypothetical protein